MKRTQSGKSGTVPTHDPGVLPQIPPPGRHLGRPLSVLNLQVVRFALVGVANSAFAFGVFAALQLTLGGRLHYMVVLVVATIVGILEAYVMQRWLVFRVSGRWWRELVRFSSVYGVALGVNAVTLPLLVEVVHVPVLPAQAFVMLATALGTFAIHRVFTFRRPTSTSQPTATDASR